MKSRPATFTMISVLLTTILISSIAYILTNDFSLQNVKNIYLGGLLVCSGGLLMVAALGTWHPRPWGYLSLMSALGIVAALDVIALITTKTFSIYYLPDIVLIGSGIMILWDPTARDLFFDASKRWWERAKRMALGLPSVARTEGNHEGDAVEIMNISESGCLLKSTIIHKAGSRVELRILPALWLQATVVRENGHEVGAKFEFRNWRERYQLKKFMAAAKSIKGSIRPAPPVETQEKRAA